MFSSPHFMKRYCTIFPIAISILIHNNYLLVFKLSIIIGIYIYAHVCVCVYAYGEV